MGEERIPLNIKILRKQKKVTLKELSERTGLTRGYLSKIERSEKAPPYSTVNKIAIALGVDTSFLLDEKLKHSEDLKISFTQKSKGQVVETFGSFYGYKYEALAHTKHGKNMLPYIIEPAFDEQAIFNHEGEEFIYVLEGRHEFTYNGKKYLMKKGDSVYFDSNLPHTGKSVGKKKAKLLAVMFNYKRL